MAVGQGSLGKTKNLTLRLDPDLARGIELLAFVENSTVSDLIRELLKEHVEKRRGDEQFMDHLAAAFATATKVFQEEGDRTESH